MGPYDYRASQELQTVYFHFDDCGEKEFVTVLGSTLNASKITS